MYVIRYSHTTQEDQFETWAEVWEALSADWPERYVVDAFGFYLDEWSDADLSDGRAMVWGNENDSVNDDGVRAVATVSQTF